MNSTPHSVEGSPERGPLELDNVGVCQNDGAPLRVAGEGQRTSQLRVLLASRHTVWAIIAASLALCAPAIATGYIYDDYFHTVALSAGESTPAVKRAPWDAYRFASSPAQIHQLIEECVVPWWSDPHARMAFFRPLASFTLWLDHRLWPGSPALMHIHSLFWYGLLLYVIASVYRRFAARAYSLGFAGLALLIYGIDDAHAWSVGWLANRAALGALALGFAALLVHDRWRSSGDRRFLFGALSLVALALGFGESAIQAVAYFVAYALFLDTSPNPRWRSLLPYAVLIIGWRVAYVIAGYGAAGSTYYIDPLNSPLDFTTVVAQRLPVLLAAQLGGLSADLGDVLQYAAPSWAVALAPLCLFVVGVNVWLFFPLWATRREVRFWTVGMVLSTLPVCALPSADRLLVAPGLGGAALIAIFLLAVLDRAREIFTPGRRFWAAILAVIHLAIAPLLLPLQTYGLTFIDKYIGDAEQSIPAGHEVADKTVVLLNPPTDEFGIFAPMRRRARGDVMPEHLRWIATGDSDLMLTRVDAETLNVRPSQGFFAPGSFGTLRSPAFKSRAGDVVNLQGMSLTVISVTADGRPAEVQLKFDRPLDDSEFVWMRWNNRDGFTGFSPPAPGQALNVPATDARSVLVDTESAS